MSKIATTLFLRYQKVCLILFCTLFFTLKGEAQDGEALEVVPTEVLTEVNVPGDLKDRTITAIVGARLIDGMGGPVIENSVILIEGELIVAVGKQGLLEIPDGAEVVDASDLTVLPGLIDAHYHSVNNNPALQTILRNGTTSIRDPGHPFRFYQSLAFAQQPMPRVFLTGAHLDGFPGVYKQQATLVQNAGHAQAMVYDYVNQGASAIKLYFRLPLKYYKPIIEAARHCNVPVVAHMELVRADSAILAGLDGIEHVTSVGIVLATPEEALQFRDTVFKNSDARREWRYRLWANIDLTSDRTEKLLDLMVDHGVYFTPTLATFERQRGTEGVEEYEVRAFENMMAFTGMAYQAGVRITGSSHTWGPYADPGFTIQRELELFVQAGMTPMDAISATTLVNAQYFRSQQRIGSIEKGKMADLLLVEGNPLENISNLKNVNRVMLNGVWIR